MAWPWRSRLARKCPAEVAEAADVVLGSPVAATRFLAAVARRLAS